MALCHHSNLKSLQLMSGKLKHGESHLEKVEVNNREAYNPEKTINNIAYDDLKTTQALS